MSTKPKLTTGTEANRFIEKVREKYLSKSEVFNLQDKTVTENGEVKADENYYGLDTVTVNVQPELEDKTITANGEYTSEEYGFGTVTVDVPQETPVMEPTTVISTGTEQIINPPSGVTGFSKVTVNPIDLEDKTITENGVYTSETKSGFGEVTVNVKEDINLIYKQKAELFPEDFSALENFTKVPDYCFYQDNKLQYIELPDSVTEIGQYAFNNCTALISINFSTITSIRSYAFGNCTSLINVNLPVVTSIENNTFTNCNNLINVNLPLVNSIGDTAFPSCRSLITIELPAVITINSQAFYSCTSLTSVTLGSNLTSINSNAFSNCTKLAEINIYAPKSQVTTAAQAPWSAPSTCQVNWLGGE